MLLEDEKKQKAVKQLLDEMMKTRSFAKKYWRIKKE